MAEWLKAHDSKSCRRVGRLGGSNPLVSAIGLIKYGNSDSYLAEARCESSRFRHYL